jgi:hypothetical protein
VTEPSAEDHALISDFRVDSGELTSEEVQYVSKDEVRSCSGKLTTSDEVQASGSGDVAVIEPAADNGNTDFPVVKDELWRDLEYFASEEVHLPGSCVSLLSVEEFDH